MKTKNLLILNKTHHTTPSNNNQYNIETKFTHAIHDLNSQFKHHLFLSTTPHNNHSNSFSTLLELLNPTRFTHSVKIHNKKTLNDIMVHHLKKNIQTIQNNFPQHKILHIKINNLPSDAPKLVLSNLLNKYQTTHKQRFTDESTHTQTSTNLLLIKLQQQLLSSIKAFTHNLNTHHKTIKHQ